MSRAAVFTAVSFSLASLVAGCAYPVDDFVIAFDSGLDATTPSADTAPTTDGGVETSSIDGATDASDASSCPTSLSLCTAACVDLATDERHCGRCDQVCSSGSKCRNGKCKTPADAGD